MNGLNPSPDYLPRWDATVGMGPALHGTLSCQHPGDWSSSSPWIEAAPPDDSPLVTQTHVSMIRVAMGISRAR